MCFCCFDRVFLSSLKPSRSNLAQLQLPSRRTLQPTSLSSPTTPTPSTHIVYKKRPRTITSLQVQIFGLPAAINTAHQASSCCTSTGYACAPLRPSTHLSMGCVQQVVGTTPTHTNTTHQHSDQGCFACDTTLLMPHIITNDAQAANCSMQRDRLLARSPLSYLPCAGQGQPAVVTF